LLDIRSESGSLAERDREASKSFSIFDSDDLYWGKSKLRQETRDWTFSLVYHGLQIPPMTFDRSIPTASDASTKSLFCQLHLTFHSHGS
jgi:hypothetical protein